MPRDFPAAASTHQPVARDRMFGGMNRGVRPFLVEANQWFTQFNMRSYQTKISQIPRKRLYANTCYNGVYPITNLVNLPVSYLTYGRTLAFSPRAVFRVGTSAVTQLTKNGHATKFKTSRDYLKWATTVYHGWLYFCNELNAVHRTNGLEVEAVGSRVPCGSFVEHYYDHLIVGRPALDDVNSAEMVMWSHMNVFSEWQSQTYTEADEYEFDEHSSGNEQVRGITGVARLGGLCLVYTPSAVYQLVYVGLPRVFRIDPFRHDVGCGFKWGLVTTKDQHFFPSLRDRTFYALSAEGIKDIGGPILSYLYADINTDPKLQQRMYGYVRAEFREIHWVYVSTASTGAYDHEVVFNYETGAWYAGSVENVHSFCGGGREGTKIDEVAGSAGSWSDTADTLTDSARIVPALWGTDFNYLLTEEVAADSVSDLLVQETPYLETGDFYYGDLSRFKEINSMVLHAVQTLGTGVNVYVSVRDNLDDTPSFTLIGLWTPTLAEKALSYPRTSGRIFRFRFVPASTGSVNVLNVAFQGACPLVTGNYGEYGGCGGPVQVNDSCDVVALFQARVTNCAGQIEVSVTPPGGKTVIRVSWLPEGDVWITEESPANLQYQYTYTTGGAHTFLAKVWYSDGTCSLLEVTITT